MSAIKRKDCGKVYHYTSETGIFGILKNRSLHFTNVEYTNDPNELKYFKDYLESYKIRYQIPKEYIIYVYNEVKRIEGYYDIFVFSTSDDKDSKALWEEYTDPKYDGFNIGFNIVQLREHLKKYKITEKNGNEILFFEDGEILYSESEKRDILDKNIASLIYHHTTNQEDADYNIEKTRTFLYLDLVFFKGEVDWSKENEYRFAIFVEKEYAKQITITKKIKNKIIPYISIDLKDENIEHPFENIAIGVENDFENDIIALRKLLDTKPYYKKLRNNIGKSVIKKIGGSMCSIKGKLLILISIIFLFSLISGCYSGATYFYPENINAMKIIKPEIGVINQISLGEAIIISAYGHYSQGIKILNTISIKNKLGGHITIFEGLYELVYSDENEYYYTPLDVNKIKYGDPDVKCQIRISDSNNIEIIAEGADLVHSALAIPITQTLNYEKIDSIFISKEDSFQQTMIYSGKSNNIIKFSYREFADDFIRNSFTTDVSYDLSESNIIGYKNFKAEIIEATNTNLKYKIISSF